MGIEPTNRMISIQSNGFEDRAQHQLTKHFRVNLFKFYRARFRE